MAVHFLLLCHFLGGCVVVRSVCFDKTWPVLFSRQGVTHAGPRVGPLGILVPSEGESPFAFMGAFIPNVGTLVNIFFFV